MHQSKLIGLVALSLSLTACENNSTSTQSDPSSRSDASIPGDEAMSDATEGADAAATIEEITLRAEDRADISEFVGRALAVAIGDVTGDDAPEIVVVDASTLRVHRVDGELVVQMPVQRAIQTLQVVERPSGPSIITGWGRGVDHPNASARVSILRYENDGLVEDIVLEPQTERAEVVSVIPDGEDLFVSWFENKYMVQTARAVSENDEWTLEKMDVTRMATSHAVGDVDHDGEAERVVGRVYGDDIGIDGDAFVLQGDQRITVPTLRGVRGMALGDLDDDGHDEIYLGDGWHQNYAAKAEARLSRARWNGSVFETEPVGHLEREGEFTIWEIVVATTDGAGDDVVIARGDKGVYAYVRRTDGWARANLGGPYVAIALGDLDDQPGDEVILAGAQSHVVSLKNLRQR